ncbi:MAG: acetamidase/formamidase family protein [Thermoplasmatales archaeon]
MDGNKKENVHYYWDSANRPVATVDSGEELKISIPDSSTLQIRRNSKEEDLKLIDWGKVDGAVGPIFINNAKPGDALKIQILDVEIGDWGWTAIFEKFGVLSNEFEDDLIIWEIKDGFAKSVKKNFLSDILIPTNPFLGIIGTAPKSGQHAMIPPQYFGGNMDNKLLTSGSVLHLPVSVEGGLISFADPHAAQGDGEVCGTAIETTATIRVKVEVEDRKDLKFPFVESYDLSQGKIMTSMGISQDMAEAGKQAVKEMIKLLRNVGYSKEEAYVLCSVTGNLRISEMVDMPNYVVSMTMPSQLFKK